MGKYSRAYLHPQSRASQLAAHPLWRGIGCILIIVVPIISFAAARLMVQANTNQGWIGIPAEMTGSFRIPFLGTVYFLDLAITLVFIIIGFGILTIFYALMYRLFGPPRYGPLDVPPD
jgi:hypothetical protein